jgi:hypothetical protein
MIAPSLTSLTVDNEAEAQFYDFVSYCENLLSLEFWEWSPSNTGINMSHHILESVPSLEELLITGGECSFIVDALSTDYKSGLPICPLLRALHISYANACDPWEIAFMVASRDPEHGTAELDSLIVRHCLPAEATDEVRKGIERALEEFSINDLVWDWSFEPPPWQLETGF